MGRRPKVVTENTEAAPAPPATTTTMRRRRVTRVDHGAQAQVLLSSLLTGRGAAGATQQELLAVVQWARSIHNEAAELKALAARVRRSKTENAAERQVALEVNQSLLAHVLAGALVVDVTSEGAIAFRQA